IGFIAPPTLGFTTADVGTNEAIDSDADPATGLTGVVALSAGETDDTVDAGVLGDGSLGDLVWNDLDADGVQGAGEPGAEAITVELRDTGGAVLATTVTDALGSYTFANLLPDTYVIAVLAPPDATFSPQDAATATEATDSDVDAAGTVTVALAAGEVNPDVDAGLVSGGTVGDHVWNDLDADGVQDPAEPGVAGMTVRLFNFAGNQLLATTTTDADGRYVFSGLLQLRYQIEFVLTSVPGATFTVMDAGSDDTLDSDAHTTTGRATADLRTDAIDLSVDAGLIGSSALGDRIWNDLDGDGLQDASEPGVGGVIVELRAADATTILASTTTDTAGSYGFDNLVAGDYAVAVQIPSGTSASPADAAPDDIDSDIDPTGVATLTLAVDEADDTIDAGLVGGASVGDRVWNDVDGDGVQSPGETDVAGMTVNLRDATDDSVLVTTATTADGTYTFSGLVPRTYVVEFVGASVPGFAAFTTPDVGSDDLDSDVDAAGRVTVDLGAVGNTVDVDAGVLGDSSIGDLVWNDRDSDGIQDPGEPGLDGVLVELRSSAGNTVASTVTDLDGAYEFTNLLPGTYRIAVTDPDGPGGLRFTLQDQGSDDAVDSDVDANGVSLLFALPASTALDTLDAGMFVPPLVQVTKTSSEGGTTRPGTRITYTISVANNGDALSDAAVTGVLVNDDPPVGTTDDTSFTIDGVLQPAGTTFPIALGDIPPGTTVTITFAHTLPTPLPNGTTVTNETSITTTSPELDPGSVTSASVTDTIRSAPAGALTKTADPPGGTLVTPGQVITYTLTLTNTAAGDDIWRDVLVVDDGPGDSAPYVPGSARLASAPLPDGPGATNPFTSDNGGVIVGDLAPADSVVASFQVRLLDPLPPGTILSNLAMASGTNQGPLFSSVTHTVSVQPGVSLTPDGSSSTEPPATVVYVHTLRNSGNVTDTYDLSAASDQGYAVTLVHDLDADGVRDAPEPTIAVSPALAPTESIQLLTIIEVPPGVVSGTIDTTTVVATSRTDPSRTDEAFDITTVLAGQLEVTKSVTPASSAVNPGQELEYTIVVHNPGGAPARNVVLVDETPGGTTYRQGTTRVDGVPEPDGSSGDRNPLSSANGGVALGDLAPGASRTVGFRVLVGSELPDGTFIVNTATATANGGLSASGSVSQIVSLSPVLDIQKTATPPGGLIEAGDVITYSIQVRNIGNADATQVRVTDDPPAATTTYVPNSTRLDGTPIADAVGGDPNPLAAANGGVSLGVLAPGSAGHVVTFQVRVADPLPDGTLITNTAGVASAEGVTATSLPVTHEVDVAVAVTLEPDRSSDVELPGQAVYPHTLTNDGTAAETFELATASSLGWTVTLYRDTDADGVWDPATETTVISSSGPVPAGGRFHFIAVIDVPVTAIPGDRDATTITATSTSDPAVSASVRDLTRAIAPRLSVVKAATPSGDQVNAGQTINYAITIRNRGAATARDVTIVDDTPTSTTYVAGSAAVDATSVPDGSGGDGNPFSTTNGGHVIGDIAPGDSVVVTLDVRVSPTAPSGTLISNEATVSATATPPTTVSKQHTVAPGPVLDVVKTADPDEASSLTARDRVRYRVSVRNLGDATANGVRLVDDTPINTQYVSGSATLDGVAVPDASPDPNPFSSLYGGIPLGNLAPGAPPVIVEFQVEVLDPVRDGDEVTNVAVTTSVDGASGSSAPVVHDIDVTPAVTVAPSASAIAVSPSSLTYAATVSNTGDVTDVYDLDAASSRGWTVRVHADLDGDGVLDTTDPEITNTPGLGPGDTYDVVVEVVVPDQVSVGLTDVTTLTATSTLDDTVLATARFTTQVVAAQLELTKTAAPLSLSPGVVSTYTLTVSSIGAATVNGVRLFDPTPAGTTYVAGSTRLDGVPVPDGAGGSNPLTSGVNLGSLAPGRSRVVTFAVVTGSDPSRTVVVNSADVTATDAPTARAGTVQPVSFTAGVDVTPTVTATVPAGSSGALPHTVTNTGDVPDEIAIDATSGLGFAVDLIEDLDGDGVADPGEPPLSGPVALDAGASIAIVVVVTVPLGASPGIVDEVTVRATSISDPAISVTVVDTISVVAPALTVTKTSFPEAVVSAGETVHFEVTVTNAGSAVAEDVGVHDPVPAGTTFAGNLTVDGAPVDTTSGNPLGELPGLAVGDLASEQTVVVGFDVLVDPALTSGAIVTNIAEAISADAGSATSAPVSLTVTDRSQLTITKTSDRAQEVAAGDVITWSLTIVNIGTAEVSQAIVRDPLPAGTAFVTGSSRLDGAPVPDDAVIGTGLDVGPLAGGQARQLTFQTTVLDLAPGTVVQNNAMVSDAATGTESISNIIGVLVVAQLPATGLDASRTLAGATVVVALGWLLLFIARPARRPDPVPVDGREREEPRRDRRRRR
ncbi:MAG: DUF11 domain-containing protein, partial [Actinobacteria bacterium]|nr:DUF11 domain-containing protein [Actinomycetota bacterium]